MWKHLHGLDRKFLGSVESTTLVDSIFNATFNLGKHAEMSQWYRQDRKIMGSVWVGFRLGLALGLIALESEFHIRRSGRLGPP